MARGWATFDLGSLTHVLTRGRAAADGMHFATARKTRSYAAFP